MDLSRSSRQCVSYIRSIFTLHILIYVHLIYVHFVHIVYVHIVHVQFLNVHIVYEHIINVDLIYVHIVYVHIITVEKYLRITNKAFYILDIYIQTYYTHIRMTAIQDSFRYLKWRY